MQSIINIIDDVIFNLKLEKFEGQRPLNELSKKLNVHAKQILRGGIGFVGFLICLGVLLFAQNSIFWSLSLLYPAFASARAVTNDDIFSKEGKLWLAYWSCFGFGGVINLLFGFILEHIPFFNLVRCCVVVWSYNQKTRGAEYLVRSLFQPLFQKFGAQFEKKIEDVKSTLEKVSQ